jgi:hypothetical protein
VVGRNGCHWSPAKRQSFSPSTPLTERNESNLSKIASQIMYAFGLWFAITAIVPEIYSNNDSLISPLTCHAHFYGNRRVVCYSLWFGVRVDRVTINGGQCPAFQIVGVYNFGENFTMPLQRCYITNMDVDVNGKYYSWNWPVGKTHY